MEQIRPPVIGREISSTQPAKCDASLVATRIEILFSAYRKADFADPIGFVAQLGTVLEQYPEWVVRHVTGPTTGIQRTSTFPPSIAEVVVACDSLYGAELQREERQRRIDQQLAERRALPNWAKRQPQNTLTYAQAQEMIRENPSIKIVGVFDRDRTIPYRG